MKLLAKHFFPLLVIAGLMIITLSNCSRDPEVDDQVKDADGNIYQTVVISDMEWLAENLKTTRYSNGDPIGTTDPVTLNTSGETMIKYQWAADGDEGKVSEYGRLYTWYAVNDARNICPQGWHVATDAEWTAMISILGGDSEAGSKLKESGTSSWEAPNDGANNSSGFTARPGGVRNGNGTFVNIRRYGYWWTSTEALTDYGWSRVMGYTDGSANRYENNADLGFSVRCVKNR
jgi:uncharacterized protein (TIGR02145 family)